jgi:hypothetical protein
VRPVRDVRGADAVSGVGLDLPSAVQGTRPPWTARSPSGAGHDRGRHSQGGASADDGADQAVTDGYSSGAASSLRTPSASGTT